MKIVSLLVAIMGSDDGYREVPDVTESLGMRLITRLRGALVAPRLRTGAGRFVKSVAAMLKAIWPAPILCTSAYESLGHGVVLR